MQNEQKNNIIMGLGLLGVILLGGSLSVYLVRNEFPIWLKIIASLGAVLSLVCLGYNWDIVRKIIFSKQTASGANTFTFIIIIFAILCLLNYLGTRHHYRLDLTKSKRFSLSDQTQKLVKQLKEPLQIHAFYSSSNPYFQNARNLLQEYTNLSNNIKLQFTNPNLNPGLAEQYQARDGNVIFEYQGRKETVSGFEEQDYSGAILKLLNKEKKKIYFLTGHGEQDLDNSEELGYSDVKLALEQENHIVDKISLSSGTTLPADISVLVIAGPKVELFPGEVNLLKKYLQSGGKAIVLIHPPTKSPTNFASLANLLTDWGIHADPDLIIEPMSTLVGGDPRAPVIAQYSYNEITRGLPLTLFPYSRTISVDSNLPPSVSTDKILETSPKSWGKYDYLKTTNPEYEPGKDKEGPLALGITYQMKSQPVHSADSTQPIPETRLVVIGNSNFIANQFLKEGGNRDLFLNAINWLTGDTELLGIRAKEPENNDILLTSIQSKLIVFTCLLFIPGLIVILGFVAWLRRR